MAKPPRLHLQALLKLWRLPGRRLLALAGVLLLALLGGWFYAQWMVQRHLAEVKVGLGSALAYTANAVQDEAAGSAALGAMMLMGLNSSVVKATASGELVPDSAAAQAQLGITRKLFGADGAYVVNSQGVVVAHATAGISSTGANIGFRPYFKNALGGTPNVYAGLGIVTNDRGLYYAAPVRDDATQTSLVIGVVMLKMPPTRIDQLLRFAGAATLLLSPQGVAFASTRDDWLLNMSPPASAQRLEDLRKLKQFGSRFDGVTPQVLPFDPNEEWASVNGQNFLVLKQLVEWNDPAGPWTLVSLHGQEGLLPPQQRWWWFAAGSLVLAVLGLLVLQVELGRRRVKAARTRSAMLGAALEASPVSIVITNAGGHIEWVNRQFEMDTGYRASELQGRHIKMILASTDRQKDFLQMAQQVLGGKAWRGELFNQRKDGSMFPGHTLVSPIFNAQGKVLGFAGLQEDTTQAVALQEELVRAKEFADAASRAKGNFLANMSHEIRTPMNAIIGMAYLVRQTDLTARQRDYVAKIEQAGQHLLGLIDDVLDISKVEAGKLRVEHITFDLAQVLERTTQLMGDKALAKGLRLHHHIAPDVPARLEGDPLRLGQILINYVTNAVKFTAQGEVRIRVRMASRELQNCLVVFEVSDTGIGLSEQQMARLFQSFEQADDSISRQFGGTGLGLSICKGLAQLMGGSVGVDSQPGHGSTFWFTARLGLTDPAENLQDRSGESAQVLDPVRGARILVVEDNLINQQVASEMLAGQGFAVALASDGQAALDAIAASHQRGQTFDLVLMDLQMPGMDGLTALSHLRADGRNATLPVVALTANVLQEEREACANAGMNGFVGKPIDASVLWRTLGQLIQPRDGLGFGRFNQAALTVAKGSHPAPQALDDAAILAQLEANPQINVALGLRRVMGRASLYVSLLRKFLDAHSLDAQSMAAAMGQDDLATARRIAHTLKSVAGNIGATRLEFAASVLEACLQTPASQAAIEASLADVRDLLGALTAVLQHNLVDRPALAVSSEPEGGNGLATAPHVSDSSDPGAALAVCLQLKALLAAMDFAAEQCFTRHQNLLQAELGPDFAALKDAMAAFDFEQAGQILDLGPLHRLGNSQ